MNARPQLDDDAATRRPLMGEHAAAGAFDPDLGTTDPTSVDILAAAQDSAKPRVTWPVAAAIAGAVVCVMGGLMLFAAFAQGPRLRLLPSDMGAPAATEPQVRQQWLQDVLAAQKQFAQGGWDPVAPNSMTPRTGRAADSTSLQPARGRGASKLPPSAPATENNVYTAMFGSPERFARANAHPSVHARPAASAAAQQSIYRGTILHGYLQSELASEPVGGPTVALLPRAMRLGPLHLPAGTQVHGSVRGASTAGARVFVDFEFLRLPSGATYNIAAVAQDSGGRVGLAGKRHMTRATAGSVGLASVGRAVQAAGREFAGTAGRVLGAGVEGAAESGSDKAQRLDRDESVVIVPRQTPLRIYLTDARLD